jgi:hypothetical protein
LAKGCFAELSMSLHTSTCDGGNDIGTLITFLDLNSLRHQTEGSDARSLTHVLIRQVWPLKIIPFMYGYLSLLLLPYNWLPTIAMGLAIPRWPAMPIIVCYWLLYLPNRILLSRDFEWLSVWCWTGTAFQVHLK